MFKLKLSDILITIVIALVFGVIYRLWSPVYESLGPFGLHVDQLLYGMWFIAATVAFLIIRKAGVALLAEVAASSGELIMGSEYGLEVLIYGFLQGLFAEAVFAILRYKSYSLMTVSLAAIASCLASFIMDFYKGYIDELVWWNLALFLLFRFIGSILISGVLAYYLVKALEATGVTTLIRGATKEDYESL
ncbi:ECF transporter S component [Bacillus spongiae]|uniref:ECF transporter S component n=1 Tax=Bacillus spongiae TaxID=2683610 RepID=A0ABU8HCH1_9BACI